MFTKMVYKECGFLTKLTTDVGECTDTGGEGLSSDAAEFWREEKHPIIETKARWKETPQARQCHLNHFKVT